MMPDNIYNVLFDKSTEFEYNSREREIFMDGAEAGYNLAEFESKWINISERPPQMGTWNICFYKAFVMCLYFNSGGRFTFDGEERTGVTHWMPLPKPPIR